MPAWLSLLRKAREQLVENWPIKVTALVLSALLWIATASREPTTQVVPVQLTVDPPPGRALRQPLPPVRGLFSGSLRDLIKLYGEQPSIHKAIPDTVSGSQYTLELSPADLNGYGATVRPQDVQPRIITVQLDEVMQRTVPVIPRVSIQPDSGFAQFGGIVVEPNSLIVRGPEARVRELTAVYTVPWEMSRVREPVRRSVPIDTAGLSPVRLSRDAVEVSANVGPLSDRVLADVPVEIRDETGGSAWRATPASVLVTLRGSTPRVARLTLDSIDVVAFASGREREQLVTLSVIAPAGIATTVTPDTVRIRRR